MRPKRILIVDDEADIREIAQVSMELGGEWQTFAAGSGREALSVAVASQPDVILLDVMMPELDGPGTLALLRADVRTRAIPVIFLTAKVQLSEQRQLQVLDAIGLIPKPFDPMILAQRVTRLVRDAS